MATETKIGFDIRLEHEFIRAVNWASWLANQITASKGFNDNPPTDAECVALVHSEASEMLEALRHGNPADDKIPDFLGTEAEGADVVIRLLSWFARRRWRLGEAIMAKMRYNTHRCRMHGGKKF